MEHELDCAIVRDLLPSYVDGLTSEATNRAVKEHLSGCADCAAVLSRMNEQEAEICERVAEVDYLKKVRRRSTRRSLVIGIILMLLGMAILSFRFFYVGSAADAEDVACHVTVEGGTVTVSGTLTGGGLGVSRVVFSDSAGMVQMKVYTAPKTFWNSGDFHESYTVGSDVGQVRNDDLILWEDGVEISATTAQLFRAVNPYVGDMSANSRIAALLGISDQFGPFTNELQTSSEPYGWTLLLENSIEGADERTAQERMAVDSYVLLASIGNLGYVTWQYETEAGTQKYTVTTEDATTITGGDIKTFADSASDFQTLLQSLRLK
ncbi:MAG: DUF4825 domain-containing protein [Oscillospiraceae bacterium]|nr:DUF4825 domain-containing protein [Oscillospiraceae bacterium]